MLGSIGFSILWDSESIKIDHFDTRNEPDFVEDEGLSGEIYNELVATEVPMTAKELEQAIGGKSTAHTIRKAMEQEPGVFEVDKTQPRNHLWSLIKPIVPNIVPKYN